MKKEIIPLDFSVRNEEHVHLLQKNLEALGYKIGFEEVAEKKFGAATKKALLAFKGDFFCKLGSLEVDLDTINTLNGQLEDLHQIRGFVTNGNSMPIENITVDIYWIGYNSQEEDPERKIGSAVSLSDGSFCAYLNIPKNYIGKDGLLNNNLCIKIVCLQNQEVIPSDKILIQDTGDGIIISSDAFIYTGKTVYQSLMDTLDANEIDATYLLSLEQSNNIAEISSFTGIDKEVIMKLLLSEMLKENYNGLTLLPMAISEAIFGYLYQNYPQNVPTQLFYYSQNQNVLGLLGISGQNMINETQEQMDLPIAMEDKKTKVIEMGVNDWEQYKNDIMNQIKVGLLLMPEDLLWNVLDKACRENIIYNYGEEWISSIVNFFVGEKINLDTENILEGNVSISDIIENANTGLDDSQKKEIANLFIAHLNDFNEFIKKLGSESNRIKYGSSIIDELLLCFQVSRVVRNYLPLVNLIIDINSYWRQQIINDIRNIATISLEEWNNVLNESSEYPDDFESSEEYAEFVYQNAQALYPNIEVVLSKIESLNEFPMAIEIKRILQANRDFDILTDRIEDLEIVGNDALIKEFKTIQHVYRISPSANAAAVLLQNNIKNAGQIYFLGKEQLNENLKNKLEQEEIDAVFDIASARFSSSLVAFANINHKLNGVGMNSILRDDIENIVEELQNEFPDIETLFGDTDYCECPHDSSVYSAAAYLADLLYFLDSRKTRNIPVKKFFDKRRADISQIYLNEHNTNTIMPYIDLVCEVLEEVVLKESYGKAYQGRTPEECQSTLSSKELCAAPEHILLHKYTDIDTNTTISATAYDIIKESIYPMYAPLNLYQIEIRAYLEKMGIKRYQLMETFKRETTETINNITAILQTPQNVCIAAEYFGLTSFEQGVVVGIEPNTIAERNKAWRDLETISIEQPNDIIIMLLSDFMRDSGMSVYEAIDTVQAKWTKLSFENFFDDCSVKDKKVTGTPNGFDRAHRFIRLWRKSGWKIWELNLLLKSKTLNNYHHNNDNLTPKTLHNLMLFKQQQEELGLACENLLAFYNNINTKEICEKGKTKTTLYDKLFLNKSLNPDSKFKTPNTVVIQDTDKSFVAACLSISEADYNLLYDEYGDEVKDLKFLSYLYRSSVLAKKLKISIQELYVLFKLIFEQGNVKFVKHYTLEYVNKIIAACKAIKESKITISEYEYLVKYGYNDVNAIALTQTQLEGYYKILKEEILTAPTEDNIENPFAKSEYVSVFTAYLSEELEKDPADIEEFIKLIECRSDKSEAEIDTWAETFFSGMSSSLLYPIKLESKDDLINRYVVVVQYINSVHTIAQLAIPTENDIENPFAKSEYVSVFTAHLSKIELYKNKTDIEEFIKLIECRSDKNEAEIDTWAEIFFSGMSSSLLYPVELESKDDLIGRYRVVVQYINNVYKELATPVENDIKNPFIATSEYVSVFTAYLSEELEKDPADIEEFIKLIECRSDKSEVEIDAWAEIFFSGMSSNLLYPVELESKDDLKVRYNAVVTYINSVYTTAALAIIEVDDIENPFLATSKYIDVFTTNLLGIELYNNAEYVDEIIKVIECRSDKSNAEIDTLVNKFFFGISSELFYPVELESKDDLIGRYGIIIKYFNNKYVYATAIKNHIAKFFDLASGVVDAYLDFSATTESLLDKILNYLRENLKNELYETLVLIHKVALTVKKNDINESDFRLLLDIQNKIGFDWFGFKVGTDAGIALQDLLKLSAMVKLQKSYGTKNEQTLFGIIKNYESIDDNFFNDLCALINCNKGVFSKVVSNICLNLNNDITNFYKPETYARINGCMKMIAIAGVSVETITGWREREDDEIKCVEVKNAAKSHYSADAWLDELPALQKPIREAKSDALASYLIAYDQRKDSRRKKRWNEKTDLYSYFLLDTEMSACMKTSRIVQATLSVQLFVQRCFLNLEDGVIIDETKWKHWEWMKKYRLWEANRKVFLYPENWIEPELRDDKTPFFKELEDELNQNDITQEHAETVFENYLQKLHTVSNLMVCGIYHETDEVDILHVIARTKSSPFEYYYRTYRVLDKLWSHWEKIDLDIKGDVVIPMVYNRKLHLFWLSTVEKARDNDIKTPTNNPPPPYKYTEIQLGWSVLKNKKWTGVQYSHKKFIVNKHSSTIKYSLIANYLEEKNEIKLNVWLLPEDTTTVNLSGCFYFDGDVYKTVSYFKDTTTFDTLVKEMTDDVRPSKNISRPTYTCNLYFHNLLASRLYSYNGKIYLYKLNQILHVAAGMLQHSQKIGAHISSPPLGQTTFNRLTQQDTSSTYGLFYNHTTGTTDFLNRPNSTINTQTDNMAVNYANQGLLHFELMHTENQDPNIVLALHANSDFKVAIAESHLYHPFFYQDSKRSFFITPPNKDKNITNYTLYPFYHAYTNLFIKELNHYGIDGLLNRKIQIEPQKYNPENKFNFNTDYNNIRHSIVQIAEPYQNTDGDTLDFHLSGAYSVYNWELFFHTPLYIACKLSQNQKYEEAMKWFHYIFDPTDKSSNTSPQKFWIPKPFFTMSTQENRKQQIENILKNISEHAAEVNAWLNNPYKPHLVARTRPVAYQRAVVMKYIDNLIDWADQLFRQDSMESNNEATLLYILAYEILGKRPVMLPENNIQPPKNINYEEIANGNRYNYLEYFQNSFIFNYTSNNSIRSVANPIFTLPAYYMQKSDYSRLNINFERRNSPILQLLQADNFEVNSNFRVNSNIERRNHQISQPEQYESSREVTVQNRKVTVPKPAKSSEEQLPNIDADNFCIPYNDKLLSYWDLVEDRLFKLRNCMNIDGIVRELPLFEPPIDPAMLVKAAAAGLSIADALNDITAPQPYYRFRVILQKAVEFAGEVKQLGDKLLSALEKKDAETLNLLRSSQEITMQQAMKQLRKLQIEEAKQNVDSILESIKITERKKEYYDSREYMNGLENSAYGLGIAANVLDSVGSQLSAVATGLSLIPQFAVGISGILPVVSTTFGGQQISAAVNSVAISLSGFAKTKDKTASLISTQAGYQRRMEEWKFQAQMAGMELKQLDVQLTAAQIRLMMAEKELENLEMQIEQSQAVKEYYQHKYTNEALYNWMITQISTVYFQAYKLAYDMAKKAEKCYCHELGIYAPTNFINFGYWDSLKKGLLSGDLLIHDLHRLDAAYIDKNQRTMELTKHISLAQMFPKELITLITTGNTSLNLEEFIFDMDYPGHYMRRIKSVSVTIPNVAGPYTTVSFMLTLKDGFVRKVANCSDYGEPSVNDIEHFYYHTGGSQSICTSSAQNDSGMFELNFGDERYLPFENAGVISNWQLSLPAGVNQFDLSTISDVILHINYTARYDGNLAEKAKVALESKLPKAGAILFSPKQDFPDAWNQMEDNNSSMNFEIKTENLPFFLRGSENINTTNIAVLLSVRKNEEIDEDISPYLTLKSQNISLNLQQEQNNGDMLIFKGLEQNLTLSTVDKWELTLGGGISPSDIEDIVIGFSLEADGLAN